MHLRKLGLFFVLLVGLLTPATARADWLLTPFAGVNFGGETPKGTRKANYGASIGYTGSGVLGIELEFAHSPDFYKPDGNDGLIGDSSITTVMANLIIGAPIGGLQRTGVRPYVSGGLGLLKADVEDLDGLFKVSDKDWGVNVGGGLRILVSSHVGLRGDLRYFRNISEAKPNILQVRLGDFYYWRASAGLVIR